MTQSLYRIKGGSEKQEYLLASVHPPNRMPSSSTRRS
jgi:hypothetical protein